MVVMQGVRHIEVLHFLRGSAHMRRVHLKVPASSYVMLCYLLETTAFYSHFLLRSQSINSGQPFCALTCAWGTCCSPRGQQGVSYSGLIFSCLLVFQKRNSLNLCTSCCLSPFAAESMWSGAGELVSVLSKSLRVSLFLTPFCTPDMSAVLEKAALSLDKSPPVVKSARLHCSLVLIHWYWGINWTHSNKKHLHFPSLRQYKQPENSLHSWSSQSLVNHRLESSINHNTLLWW